MKVKICETHLGLAGSSKIIILNETLTKCYSNVDIRHIYKYTKYFKYLNLPISIQSINYSMSKANNVTQNKFILVLK